MTAQLGEQLRKSEARYQRASRRAEKLRQERNQAVLEAIAAGLTHAQIARATGLTRARIGQIALVRAELAGLEAV